MRPVLVCEDLHHAGGRLGLAAAAILAGLGGEAPVAGEPATAVLRELRRLEPRPMLLPTR